MIKSFRVKDLDQEHFAALHGGMEADADFLDVTIAACLASGWTVDRLTLIERSLLRAGTLELCRCHICRRARLSANMLALLTLWVVTSDSSMVLDKVAKTVRVIDIGQAR